MGCSTSEIDFSSVDAAWAAGFARKPAPSWVLYSFLQGMSTCSGVGSSMGCRVDICFTVVLHGLQGDNLLHCHHLYGLQGTLCCGTWSTYFPSVFTDLSVCRDVSPLFVVGLYRRCEMCAPIF